MAFITSKMQPVDYDFYQMGPNKINTVVDSIHLNGGADVVNKRTLETPTGVITEISDDKLEKLKSHPVFQIHLKNGYVSILGTEKEAKIADKDLKEDKSSQITPADYEKGNDKKEIKPKKKPTTKK